MGLSDRFRRQRMERRDSFQQVAGKVLSLAAANVDDPGVRNALNCASQGVQLLGESEFLESIGRIIPSRLSGLIARKRYRDSEFDAVAELLKLRGKLEWAQRPKHYVILHAIGREDAMDAIVKEKRWDICIPYHEDNLPNALKGEAREEFLKYQANVLTGKGEALERPGGQHQNFGESSADGQFVQVCQLGAGTGGVQSEVYHVLSKLSWKPFALKKIARASFSSDDARSISIFTNELNILKSLEHRHIVQLIGSYTDRDYVGLLLYPVADMNLGEYLQKDLDPKGANERRMKIRTFFGCIAIAIDYLHNNKTRRIRHKDIKPANILVKQDKGVFVADFGISHAWSEDGGLATKGTSKEQWRTPKYAAPESTPDKQDTVRDTPADMWSLGCVFLEMCTVLAGLPYHAIKDFFLHNGTHDQRYYLNPSAIDAWLLKLQDIFQRSDVPQDECIVELVKDMCQMEPRERLDARDLVRRIFELQSGVRYYGLCCPKERWLSHDHSTPFEQIRRNIYSRDNTTASDDATIADDGDEEDGMKYLGYPENYHPPTVEEQEMTLLFLSNEAPRNPRHVIEDVTLLENSDNPESRRGDAKHSAERSCKSPALFDPGTTSTTRGTRNSAAPMPTAVYHKPKPRRPHFVWPKLNERALSCPWPNCWSTKRGTEAVLDSFASLQKHLLEHHHVHEYAWSRILDKQGQKDGDLGYAANSPFVLVPSRAPRVRFADSSEEPQSKSTRREIRPRRRTGRILYTINAEPLGTLTGPSNGDSSVGPSTSLAPSYLLASNNRFSISQLLGYKKRGEKPLFVYGSLMFPSVLTGRARAFAFEKEGVYSTEKGRRLRTTSRDWGYVDKSIVNAAESMTPARLVGYNRVRDKASRIAHLKYGSYADSDVSGFVIVGLSREAMNCLEHLFEKGGPRHLFDRVAVGNKWVDSQMLLRDVQVTINASDGSEIPVDAVTFIADDAVPFARQVSWNVNEFVRSRTFTSLTDNLGHGAMIDEEMEIARALGTTLVLPGDELVARALEADLDGIDRLLDKGFDVNAASPGYGCALQAAASRGHLAVMNALIQEGAHVDARGGRYGCPLIAAVVENKPSAVKLLLRNNANVFTPGGKYISAIYQAVDFGNLQIAHYLLEKGAWLTENYGELLDLASERGDEEMREQLVRYDVRGFHINRNGVRPPPKPQPSSALRGRNQSLFSDLSGPVDGQQYKGSGTKVQRREGFSLGSLVTPYAAASMNVAAEAMRLYNQEGKWTGIKGVQLLTVALDNGFSERLIQHIRPHMHSWSSIQRFLSEAAAGATAGKLRATKHTNLLRIADDSKKSRSEDDTVSQNDRFRLEQNAMPGPPSSHGRKDSLAGGL